MNSLLTARPVFFQGIIEMTNRQKFIETEIKERTAMASHMRASQALIDTLLWREEDEIQKLTDEYVALAEAEAKGEMEVINCLA